MGTSPKVSGQDPAKLKDAPAVFLKFFKLTKEDKMRTKPITEMLIKQKSNLEKSKKLSGDDKKRHTVLKRDVAIWSAGYNVYRMTDDEKNLAAKYLELKTK